MLTFKQFLLEAKKSEEDPYYYHITKGSNMSSIAKRGLSRKPGHRNYSFSKRGSVYLASTPKAAKSYAPDIGTTEKYIRPRGKTASERKMSGDVKTTPHSLRVIRIPKASLDPKHIHRDKNMEGAWRSKEKPKTWEYHGDIPVKKIEFSGGDHIKKNTRSWKRVTNN